METRCGERTVREQMFPYLSAFVLGYHIVYASDSLSTSLWHCKTYNCMPHKHFSATFPCISALLLDMNIILLVASHRLGRTHPDYFSLKGAAQPHVLSTEQKR